MLYEDDIVNAVCEYLIKRGFSIDRRCLSTQRGDDIVASHPSGIRLFIEAKGEGSARVGSARHGHSFNGGQVFDVVAKAFYRAASMLQQSSGQGEDRFAGIAVPDTAEFRRRVQAIEQSLNKLGLVVFWVEGNRNVKVSGQFPVNAA